MQEQRRPRVHRRVHVAVVPLVGGDLAAGVHVRLAQHELELLAREIGIDRGERDAVEREVPCRVPRVLPLVRHRYHVVVDHVIPVAIAHRPRLPEQRMRVVLLEPAIGVEGVVLLRPQHAGERLAHDECLVGGGRRRRDRGVEDIGLADPVREDAVERAEARTRGVGTAEAKAHDVTCAGADRALVVCGNLGARARRIHRLATATRRRTRGWRPSRTATRSRCRTGARCSSRSR